MAFSNEGEFLWEAFYKNFLDGGYYEFKYKDKYFNVGREIEKKLFQKIEKWIFVVHRHDNTGSEIYSIYESPHLLLENARVDGKSIKEIWEEIKIE